MNKKLAQNIKEEMLKKKADTVLDKIQVGPSKKYNPFGEAQATVPRGFYFNSNKGFGFKDAPAGYIPTNAIIYSDGDNQHSLYVYDNDSNTFVAKTEPFYGYDEWRAKKMVNEFLNNVERITETKAKALIEKNKGVFEGTAEEIIDYLNNADSESKFRIQKI